MEAQDRNELDYLNREKRDSKKRLKSKSTKQISNPTQTAPATATKAQEPSREEQKWRKSGLIIMIIYLVVCSVTGAIVFFCMDTNERGFSCFDEEIMQPHKGEGTVPTLAAIMAGLLVLTISITVTCIINYCTFQKVNSLPLLQSFPPQMLHERWPLIML